MSPLERLARANELRHEVANVDRLRAELAATAPREDRVEIAVTMRALVVDCGGESRVETWHDFGPTLGSGEHGLTVRILAGSRPADVRACLEQLAADYETSYFQITARSEEVASEILGCPNDGIPF